MERNMEYSYILRRWQHIEGSKHVDCGHVWRDRNCCCNPAVCYSITSLNQATEELLSGAKVCNETQLLSVCFHHGRHCHGFVLPDIHWKAEELPNKTSIWAEWHRQDNCTPLWVGPYGGAQFMILSWSFTNQGVSTLVTSKPRLQACHEVESALQHHHLLAALSPNLFAITIRHPVYPRLPLKPGPRLQSPATGRSSHFCLPSLTWLTFRSSNITCFIPISCIYIIFFWPPEQKLFHCSCNKKKYSPWTRWPWLQK